MTNCMARDERVSDFVYLPPCKMTPLLRLFLDI